MARDAPTRRHRPGRRAGSDLRRHGRRVRLLGEPRRGIDRNFVTGLGSPHGMAVDSDHIYWTDSATDTIGRADLDGTNVNPGFITNGAGDVAVDAHNVYWTNSSGVGRANLDGSGIENKFVSVKNLFPHDVAVDDAHVWWVEQTGLGRASLSG